MSRWDILYIRVVEYSQKDERSDVVHNTKQDENGEQQKIQDRDKSSAVWGEKIIFVHTGEQGLSIASVNCCTPLFHSSSIVYKKLKAPNEIHQQWAKIEDWAAKKIYSAVFWR